MKGRGGGGGGVGGEFRISFHSFYFQQPNEGTIRETEFEKVGEWRRGKLSQYFYPDIVSFLAMPFFFST